MSKQKTASTDQQVSPTLSITVAFEARDLPLSFVIDALESNDQKRWTKVRGKPKKRYVKAVLTRTSG